MIFPDFAFGYDHRDYLPPALKAQGAEVIAQIAIPPTESSFTKYFPQIPADTEVIYHVMVGPAVLTFVKELGEFYGSNRPQLFGFIDSLEAVDINSPGLEFLDGSHFWEGSPRYAQADDTDAQKAYRAAVGIDDNGASVDDPKDISTAAHMFGCWETLYVIKKAMEDAGYQGRDDARQAGRGDRGADRVRRGPRASAGRQDLQRQDPPVLRHPEHLQGRGRQAQGRAHDLDRGRHVRARRRLHHAAALILCNSLSPRGRGARRLRLNGIRTASPARHARRARHVGGAGADGARPVAGVRRHARGQCRAWRVLHAGRGARLGRHRDARRPSGARLPRRAGHQPADRRRGGAACRAAGAASG